jgi:hypothetical protein
MNNLPGAFRIITIVGVEIIAAAAQGVPGMNETLRNVVRRSDVVVVTTMLRTSLVQVGETQFLRAETEVRERLKGVVPSSKVLTVDIRTAGKETPALDAGKSYVLFLMPLTGGSALLVQGMRPVSVPAADSDRFLRCLRQSVTLYERNPSDRELTGHAFEMLASGVSFFASDATRLGLEIPVWDTAELDRWIAFLTSERGQHAITGEERINAEAVVAKSGDPGRIAAFARAEYRLGAGDGIYYGMLQSKKGPDALLADLLSDPDDRVKIGALRLAGLFRRGDIVDSFEKRSAGSGSDAVRSAIVKAQALVKRIF